MATELRFVTKCFLDGGMSNPLNQGMVAHKAVTLSDNVETQMSLTVQPSEVVTLWQWAANRPSFELVMAYTDTTGGYLELAWQSDAVASGSTTFAAAGTAVSWNFMDLSCHAPFVMTTDIVKVNPTIATSHGDSAGAPTRWSNGATVNGRVYRIVARNPGATGVNLNVLVLN